MGRKWFSRSGSPSRIIIKVKDLIVYVQIFVLLCTWCETVGMFFSPSKLHFSHLGDGASRIDVSIRMTAPINHLLRYMPDSKRSYVFTNVINPIPLLSI